MKTKQAQATTHRVEGEFFGFLPKPGSELKYMQLQVGERRISVKLAKELREPLGKELVKHDRLLVFLQQKSLGIGSPLKLKTHRVEKYKSGYPPSIFESAAMSEQGKILLCYNSSCVKRGGKKLYYALAETLHQLGLQDQVRIEMTGCQKQCKKAPSFILMPGRVIHNYVHPEELPSLLKGHYSERLNHR